MIEIPVVPPPISTMAPSFIPTIVLAAVGSSKIAVNSKPAL